MYTDFGVWMGIVLGGVAGCFATALFANWLKGVPFAAVGLNIKKHIWSIIFAIPVPFLLGWQPESGIFVAFLWLMLAPTIASKIYFGPKDVPAIVLNAFHCGYAVTVLTVYVLVTRYFSIAASSM
ncbi:MAG: hypothetical protein WBC71_02775 [Salaquimonas sp.]